MENLAKSGRFATSTGRWRAGRRLDSLDSRLLDAALHLEAVRCAAKRERHWDEESVRNRRGLERG